MFSKIAISISIFLTFTVAHAGIQPGSVAFINADESKIVELNLNGDTVWEYNLPWKLRSSSLRSGADIEWIEKTDSFLFVVPKTGIFEVNRNKEIVWEYYTKNVSHDADLLTNGNVIFVNGWDTEKSPTFTEITRAGKIVQEWYAYGNVDHLERINNATEQTYSYTHANAVERLNDGSTLVSLRNFSRYVIVKNGKIVSISNHITWVHDPIIGNGQKCFAARKPNKLICITNGEKKILLTDKELEWSPLRTVELLKNKNILITGSFRIGQIDQTGNIVWQLKLPNFVHQKSGGNFIYKAAWVYKN